MSGAIWAVMLVVGSSLSAIVTAAAGPSWCFVIDAASFLCSAALIARLSQLSQGCVGIRRDRTTRRGVLRDVLTTFRIVQHDRVIATLLAAKPGTALGNGILAVFPVLVAEVFHVGAAGIGVLFAARGVGALSGPLIARRFVTDPSRVRPVVAAAIAVFGAG